MNPSPELRPQSAQELKDLVHGKRQPATLVGRDPITARHLYGRYFTFEPVAKFLFAVNHRPRVMDDSLAVVR